jgi:hypothetical protein
LTYRSDLNAFKQSLFKLSVGWKKLPLRDADILRLQLTSEKTSMLIYVAAFIVPNDELDEGEKPEQGNIALYNRDGEFMLDTGFFLTYHSFATEFIRDIIEERHAVVVYDKDGDWGGSVTIRAAGAQKDRKPTVDDAIHAVGDDVLFAGRPIRYIRSWNGTYDWR